MSEEFEQPEELSINKVFQEDYYSIPIYQRSYAWTDKQIEQLITDLHDFATQNRADKPDEKYFLGSLIVDKVSNHSFSVIDGQQRLTTLYLLMSYIDKSLLRQNCLTFEAREKSNTVLKDLQSPKFERDGDFEDGEKYNDEIVAGIKVIQQFFKSPKNTNDTKEEYIKKILSVLDKVKLIRTQVPKNIDLNHYFEIMNTRGEQLELHEIAKGRILDNIKDKKEQQTAATIWDACSLMDDYIQMCIKKDVREKIFEKNWKDFNCNNFEEVHAKFIEAEQEEAKKKQDKEKVDISKLYSLEQIITDTTNIKTLKEKKEDGENERFESIINFPNFLMIVNEAKNLKENEDDSGLDDKQFIEKLQYIWDNKDGQAAKRCKQFIFDMLKMKYLFDRFIIKREFVREYKNDGKWSLERLETASDPDKPKYVSTFSGSDIEDEDSKRLRTLQSGLRITYTSPKTMHWISKTLHEVYHTETQKITVAQILHVLEKYACKKVQEANYHNKKGFDIERIVFTYLDYILFRDFKNETFEITKDNKFKYGDFQYQFRTSIEHFHPQHPIQSDNIEDWNTQEDRQSYLNDLGNLVLITVKANSRFSNLSPNSKIENYPDTLKQSLKFIEMEKLRKKNEDWTKNCVTEHCDIMMKLLDDELKKNGYF